MTVGIYQITNTTNGKKYIGQSIDIERRLNQHKRNLTNNNHSNQHLQKAWNKYGSDTFTFDIIKECSESLLNYYEKEYIFTWNLTNHNNGYNIQDGGGHFRTAEETRKKISEACKDEKHPMFGKHHSKNTKIKMSKARNTTGFYSVSIQPHSSAKQGFCFRYNYTKNKKRKGIYSVSIFKLEQRVRDAGLEWKILDDELAAQTIALSPN